MILLDRHVLVWLDADLADLGHESAASIDRAFADGGVWVSAISFWEIGMLVGTGRLTIARHLAAWREELLTAGLREWPVDGSIALQAAELAQFQGDPADRLAHRRHRKGDGRQAGHRRPSDPRVVRLAEDDRCPRIANNKTTATVTGIYPISNSPIVSIPRSSNATTTVGSAGHCAPIAIAWSLSIPEFAAYSRTSF